MRCSVCGQEYDQPVKFCPNCGVPQSDSSSAATSADVQPAEPAQPVQPTPDVFAQPAQQAYIRQDYTPAPPPQPQSSQQPYSTPTPGYTAYAGQAKPSATGQIVFSIINIICCGGFISTILGIIALIFAIMASSETNYDEAERKLKTAKLLNIIGIVIVGLSIIVTIILALAGFSMFDWNSFSEFGY